MCSCGNDFGFGFGFGFGDACGHQNWGNHGWDHGCGHDNYAAWGFGNFRTHFV